MRRLVATPWYEYVLLFEGGQATESLAIDRGIAFQLTNILRDLREDAALGRVYIPRGELHAAGIDDETLRAGQPNDGFGRMMRDQINRARISIIAPPRWNR